MARRLGVEVDLVDFGLQSDIDLTRAEEALRADQHGRYKAVLAVHVDTSTSVKNDIAGLRKAMDASGHEALLMVDCIASLGVDRFEMDDWGVDVMVAASQKGLMTPAGMSFVFYNEKADAVRNSMAQVSSYWDWQPRTRGGEPPAYFCGTPPTHHLFGLREAMTMLVHEEGVEAAWHRHGVLARAVWAAFDGWAHHDGMRLNITDQNKRSHAVTSAAAPSPKGTHLRRWMEAQTGVTLGIGIGMAPLDDPERDGFFRVGHMGHVNAHMVLGVLASMEAGMHAIGIPLTNSGVAAAAKVVGAEPVEFVKGSSVPGECC